MCLGVLACTYLHQVPDTGPRVFGFFAADHSSYRKTDIARIVSALSHMTPEPPKPWRTAGGFTIEITDGAEFVSRVGTRP